MNKLLSKQSFVAEAFPCKAKSFVEPRPLKNRVFGTNITNVPIVVCEKEDDPKQNTVILDKEPENDASINASLFDVDQEPQAKKPFELFAIPAFEKRKVDSVAEYEAEIMHCMYGIEENNMGHFGYMAMQPDMNDKMREILIDWLAEVHLRFKLTPETLYLTVNIIDRYLEKAVISRKKLQLVGVASMLIACKYEEIYAPEIKDFAYITDNSYSKEEILDMEYRILKALGFGLSAPSAYRFFEHASVKADSCQKTKFAAQYILELCLIKYNMLKYKPSIIANAAVCLAKRLVEHDKRWDEKKMKYKEAELKPVMKEMLLIIHMSEKSNLQAIRQKFQATKYMEVARITFRKKKQN